MTEAQKKAERFLKANQIQPCDIKCILRENAKTAIYLIDERIITTYITVKDILSLLPEGDFWNINKGVVLAAGQVLSIEDDMYTMIDGRSFRGRSRAGGSHRKNANMLARGRSIFSDTLVKNLRDRFAILDGMPVPFCVIELIFDEEGHGLDFVLRYCNPEMARVENMAIADMLDRSIYELFRNADRKALVIYADVALNGGTRTIRMENERLGEVTVSCFRPEEGLCACIMTSPVHNPQT